MKETVSFFFLGTACHHASYQDVLTTYHKAIADYEAKVDSKSATYLFDGVGSDPGELAGTHPTPGRYTYDPINKKKYKSEEVLNGIYDFIKKMTGCLTGDGMDEQLFEATLYLEQLILENGGIMPKTVNLHGYSRGADACVRLANLLDSLYPEVKVNLFLIDHVPGPGRADDPNSYIIPKNVQRIEAALMLHEYTPGFEPQDRNRYVFASPQTTQVAIKVYPGWHNKAVLLTPDENTNDVPKLLHDDLFRFARETGSLPERAKIPKYKVMHSWENYTEQEAKVLTKAERFAYYNTTLNNWWLYSKGTALNVRNVLSKHNHYSQDSRLFVNQEHGELFKTLYPGLYDWFLNGQRVDEEEVHEELFRLQNEAAGFYKTFCTVNRIDVANGNLPAPHKVISYFRSSLGAVLIEDERSFFEQAIISVINYEEHHNKEGSLSINSAVNHLQKALEKTAGEDDKTAIINLKKAIYQAGRYLEIKNKGDSYLYRQLRKINHMSSYIDNLINCFITHIEKNTELHSNQKRYLEEASEKLREIKDNIDLTFMEKIRQAREISNSVISQLQSPSNSRVYSHNLFSKSLYAKPGSYTVGGLIGSLNKLNAPGFAETSMATTIARQFEAYYNRNLFWDTVHKFLNKFIDLPPFYSPKKSELAHKINLQLNVLDEIGQGNDLIKISKVLAEGQKQLHENYRSKQKQALGEFDKIMIQSQGQLNMEFNTYPIENKTNEFSFE